MATLVTGCGWLGAVAALLLMRNTLAALSAAKAATSQS